MNNEVSVVARNCRLQEWAYMIQECNNRPKDMSVKQWCEEHDIGTANYYYRLREVRKAYLEQLPLENTEQKVVPVSTELLTQNEDVPSEKETSCLEISVNGISVHVTEQTKPELLKMVLQVASHV